MFDDRTLAERDAAAALTPPERDFLDALRAGGIRFIDLDDFCRRWLAKLAVQSSEIKSK